MNVFERSFERELDVSPAVGMWNIWDFEHAQWVHRSTYSSFRVAYEDDRMALLLVRMRLPFLPFVKSDGVNVLVRKNDETTEIFNLGLFGLFSNATLTCRPAGKDRCLFTFRYRVILRGWQCLLRPLLPFFFSRWQTRIWDEDLPLKRRRQKMVRWGFVDFVGLPDRVRQRRFDGPLGFHPPLARRPDSEVDEIRRTLASVPSASGPQEIPVPLRASRTPPDVRIIEQSFERELDVDPSVALWNIWDFEHGEWVHRSTYASSFRILHEDDRTAVFLVRMRIPFIPFLRSDGVNAVVRQDGETTEIVNVGAFGLLSRATLVCRAAGRDRCRFLFRYRVVLRGWQRILFPLMPWIFKRWQNRIWNEDLGLKRRRQKVLRWGFRDFKGLPEKRRDRGFDGPIPFRLPLPRNSNSEVDEWLGLFRGEKAGAASR
jgi:hypothetical protein